MDSVFTLWLILGITGFVVFLFFWDRKRKKKFLEKLAELEHEQWVSWSKTVVDQEKISLKRRDRWALAWVPYKVLSEKNKEQDRVWARKVLALVEKYR